MERETKSDKSASTIKARMPKTAIQTDNLV